MADKQAETINLCLSYATLLLVDGKKRVDAENLGKLFEASGCDVDAKLL
jgi:ribosomal protein L12E/L44/L45/RPP1/RPP2